MFEIFGILTFWKEIHFLENTCEFQVILSEDLNFSDFDFLSFHENVWLYDLHRRKPGWRFTAVLKHNNS